MTWRVPDARFGEVRRFAACLPWLAAVAVGAETAPEKRPAEPTPESRLAESVAKLASPEFGGRRGEGGRKAADWIVERLKACGARPGGGDGPDGPSWFQPIVLPRRGPPPEGNAPQGNAPAEAVVGRNVLAVFPGGDPAVAGEYLVLGAHYDHLGYVNGKLYPGADDNASGVAALLEIARTWSTLDPRPRRSLLLAAFDLEEVGLVGSRYWVAHPTVPLEKIRLNVTLDMIGRHAFGVEQPFVFVVGSEHAPDYRRRLREARSDQGLELGFIGADLVGERSDHAPFWRKEIPFLFFSTSEHPDYHRPTDTPDRVDHAKLARITALVGAVLHRASRDAELPAYRREPLVDLEEVASVRRVLEKLLEKPERLPGGAAGVLVARNALLTLRVIEARGTITAAERQWLVGLVRNLMDNLR